MLHFCFRTRSVERVIQATKSRKSAVTNTKKKSKESKKAKAVEMREKMPVEVETSSIVIGINKIILNFKHQKK